MTKITEKSFISLGLLIVIVGVVVALADSCFQGKANARESEKLDERVGVILSIKTDVEVMKKQLERIEKKIDQSGSL